MADVTGDVHGLVAGVRRDDASKYNRLDNDKDEVRHGKRLQDFRREVIPGQLQVQCVSGNDDERLDDEVTGTDGASAEDHRHDERRDGSANKARHHQVTDGVHAHRGKRVDFGIDDHAAHVCRERRTASSRDEERRKDGAEFTDDHHHHQTSDHVAKADLAHHRHDFHDDNGAEKGRHDEQHGEDFDAGEERLQDDVPGVRLETAAFRENRGDGA